ncbi:hypothetical protein [Candidatus Bartonella washoeensis]|nr:hypothetical protein [Bartonella washoeensis]
MMYSKTTEVAEIPAIHFSNFIADLLSITLKISSLFLIVLKVGVPAQF